MTRHLDPHDPIWYTCQADSDCEGELDANGQCRTCGEESETFEEAMATEVDRAYDSEKDRLLWEHQVESEIKN